MDKKNNELSQDVKDALQFTSDSSGKPFFEFCKFKITDEEAQELLSRFVDNLLDNSQIKRKLKFYEQYLYDPDEGVSGRIKTSQEGSI